MCTKFGGDIARSSLHTQFKIVEIHCRYVGLRESGEWDVDSGQWSAWDVARGTADT